MNTRIRVLGIIILINFAFGLIAVPSDSIVGQTTDESVRVQTNEDDFGNGALNYANLSSDDEVKLGLKSRTMEENFLNESKIGYKENVNFDTKWGFAGPNIFDKTFDYKGSDDAYSLKQTDDEGFIIVGVTDYYYNYLQSVVLLIKTDSHRNEIWNKSFGSYGYNAGNSVQQTRDRGYIIAGYTESFGAGGEDAWLIKTDRYGNEQWNKTFGGTENDQFNSVQITNDGGFILTGFTKSFSDGYRSAWLIKTDFSGNLQLNKTYGGNKHIYARTVQQTSDNGYIIAGNKVIKTDQYGNLQWNKTIDCYDVLQTSDNGFVLLSYEYLSSLCGSGVYYTKLIKTDIFGNIEWTELYEINHYDNQCYSFQKTADGGYILVGFEHWRYGSILLIKTDSFGKLIWYKTYDNWGDTSANSIIQTSNGKYMIVGSIELFSDYSDIFVMQLNDLGNFEQSSYFISTNLLNSVQNQIKSVDRFSYYAYIIYDGYSKLQFSYDKKTWFDSNGKINNTTDLIDYDNTIYLSNISTDSSELYYKIEFPLYSGYYIYYRNISLTFTQYLSSGEFVSKPFKSQKAPSWKVLKWNSITPPGTSIEFQLRTAKSMLNLSTKQFRGPDGTTKTFYTSSPSNISIDHTDDMWIQYRAYCRSRGKDTPILQDVNISYNYIPSPPIIFSFENERWYNKSKPVFYWEFNDLDGYQNGFQIVIDDDRLFGSVNYDSGIQSSYNKKWRFGEGTNFSTIEDGIWYWKVRTMDNNKAWSRFSSSSILKIDTKPPINDFIVPINNYWISDNKPEILFETIDARSGLSHYVVKLDNNSFKNQISPYTLPYLKDGRHTVFVRAYDMAGNYREESLDLLIDTTHPEIKHEYVRNSKRFESITINLSVTDEHSGVGHVLLFFKNNKTKSYSAASMEENNNTFSATIPSDVTTSSISYYFKVSDKSQPSNEKYFDYWGYDLSNKLTPSTIYIPIDIERVYIEEPEKPELNDNNNINKDNINKDNINSDNEEEDKISLMERYGNYSPFMFIIIIAIIISILWIQVIGADNLLLNPYSRLNKNPHRTSDQFTQTLFIYYGEMIKPEHNDKLPPDLLKRFKANKMPPRPAEIIDRSYLIMYKKTFVGIKCSTCNKSYHGEYTKTFGSSKCPFCYKN